MAKFPFYVLLLLLHLLLLSTLLAPLFATDSFSSFRENYKFQIRTVSGLTYFSICSVHGCEQLGNGGYDQEELRKILDQTYYKKMALKVAAVALALGVVALSQISNDRESLILYVGTFLVYLPNIFTSFVTRNIVTLPLPITAIVASAIYSMPLWVLVKKQAEREVLLECILDSQNGVPMLLQTARQIDKLLQQTRSHNTSHL